MASERPSFREMYEAQTARLGDMEKRLNRLEKAMIVLLLMTMTARVGGPDASKIVAELVKQYLA